MKPRHISGICSKHGGYQGEGCSQCADVLGLLEIVEGAGKRWALVAMTVGMRRGDPLVFAKAMKKDADAGARFGEAVERLRESLKRGGQHVTGQ